MAPQKYHLLLNVSQLLIVNSKRALLYPMYKHPKATAVQLRHRAGGTQQQT
jgi:hypothetical protein